MTPRDDGGPAFPRPFSKDGEAEAWSQDGMSLRDYFAGQALAGMLGNEIYLRAMSLRHGDHSKATASYGLQAYELADAMLEARKR